jgi:hypothetical protein
MKKTLIALLLYMLMPAVSFGQQKYALVIGNSRYTDIVPLKNPVNDAKDMKDALESLGFSVEIVLDGNIERMQNSVQNFKSRLSASRNSYGFFFYAGHGVQSKGENYLIPLGANIQSENQLPYLALSVQALLNDLGDARNELNMIVLDACRDNPFGWSRSGSRGLSVVSHAPAGSFIMYATSANAKADDGDGKNGLFTGQLLKNIKSPGLSVRDVFDKTGADVKRVSGGKQIPQSADQHFETASIFLAARPSPTPSPSPGPSPSPAPGPAPTPRPIPPPSPTPSNIIRTRTKTIVNDGNEYFCDGRNFSESPGAKAYKSNLDGLNIKNFEISFDFIAESYRNQWVLMLGKLDCVLGIRLLDDGRIFVATRNNAKPYLISAKYRPRVNNRVKLVYENKRLQVQINDFPIEVIDILLDISREDNILSSINQANGIAFRGYIKNITVICEPGYIP